MADDDERNPDDVHKRIAPLVEAVGHVATHWARLEHEINKTIWTLAAIEPEDGACLTAQILAIMPRMRALIALTHRHGGSEELLKELNRFSADADKLGRRRNRVVHDPWYYTDETDKVFGRLEVSADRRLVYEIKPQTRKDVLAIAHDIVAATKRFADLKHRILTECEEQLEARRGTGSEGSPGSPDQDSGHE